MRQGIVTAGRFGLCRASAAGWRPGNRNALGYPQTWTKTYPDGVPRTLSLLRAGRAAAGVPVTCTLTASSPAATWELER